LSTEAEQHIEWAEKHGRSCCRSATDKHFAREAEEADKRGA
jgi:hypothetical protein